MDEKKHRITVIMPDGDIESIAVQQPRLTVNFLLQQSSLARQGEPEAFMIGQLFLFAAELHRSNGERIFEDFEDAQYRLHHSATPTLFDMLAENPDMQEIQNQSSEAKESFNEEEPTDPKSPCGG